MIKKIATWAAVVASVTSLLVIAFGVFVLEREIDDLYRRFSALDSKVDSLSDDYNEQRISCEVLEATVSSSKYTYTFNKCN